MISRKKLPKCIGHYEPGELICDGDPRGGSDYDRMPCVMRDRCAALGLHCSERKISVSTLVRTERIKDQDGKSRRYAFARSGDDSLQELLNKVIRRYGITNGRVTKSGEVDKPKSKKSAPKTRRARARQVPSGEARKLATQALKAKASEAMGKARKVIRWWCVQLSEITGRHVVADRREAEPGDLFLVDNLEKSKYISVYCALPGGRRSGVAVVIPQMRTGQLNFQVAAAPGDFSTEHRKRLRPQDEDGRFRSKISHLDKEGAHIVAEAIHDLIQRGIIESPPVA